MTDIDKEPPEEELIFSWPDTGTLRLTFTNPMMVTSRYTPSIKAILKIAAKPAKIVHNGSKQVGNINPNRRK